VTVGIGSSSREIKSLIAALHGESTVRCRLWIGRSLLTSLDGAVSDAFLRADLGGEKDPCIRLEVQQNDGAWPTTTREVEKAAHPGLCGVVNVGNSCFLSSAVQCLAQSDLFVTQYVEPLEARLSEGRVAAGSRDEEAIALELCHLVAAIRGGPAYVTPNGLRNAVADRFPLGIQADGAEVLEVLLDSSHETVNRGNPALHSPPPPSPRSTPPGAYSMSLPELRGAGQEAWSMHLTRHASPVVSLFQGQLLSQVECKYCKSRSPTFDPFMILCLPVHGENLYDCLEGFKQVESQIQGWQCPTCKVLISPIILTVTISVLLSLPPLTIRFQSPRGSRSNFGGCPETS